MFCAGEWGNSLTSKQTFFLFCSHINSLQLYRTHSFNQRWHSTSFSITECVCVSQLGSSESECSSRSLIVGLVSSSTQNLEFTSLKNTVFCLKADQPTTAIHAHSCWPLIRQTTKKTFYINWIYLCKQCSLWADDSLCLCCGHLGMALIQWQHVLPVTVTPTDMVNWTLAVSEMDDLPHIQSLRRTTHHMMTFQHNHWSLREAWWWHPAHHFQLPWEFF